MLLYLYKWIKYQYGMLIVRISVCYQVLDLYSYLLVTYSEFLDIII